MKKRRILSILLSCAMIFTPANAMIARAENSNIRLSDEKMVDANVLLGLTPKSNSKVHYKHFTEPNSNVHRDGLATDAEKTNSNNEEFNTEISAGTENGKPAENNGFDSWDPVYLQYDFGKEREVNQINIYRNTYDNAVSTFKDVKVELSLSEDFSDSRVVFGTEDVVETRENKGKPQVIRFDPTKARYIRIWQKGHYIQNTNSEWKGYSSKVRFNEIEVIGKIPKSEVPDAPTEGELRNIAKGKLPYVWGLAPTDIEKITDGEANDHYAIHNTPGKNWLQFEYRNIYNIKNIKLKLERGRYSEIKVSVSNSPETEGSTVFHEWDYDQGDDFIVVDLPNGIRGKDVRFTVEKDEQSPVKYSEIEIWAVGNNFDETKPEYKAPQSKYDRLVWFDEFNDDVIDESKWNIIEGMANHGAIYNRQAVSIKKDGENGYLAINSRNYDTTQQLVDAVGIDRYKDEVLGKHVTWSSGRLESKNKYSFQFGRMAVRAKVNDSKGIWPAIWMLCQDETGHDEIDVLEYLGKDPWDAWTTNHFGVLGVNKGNTDNRNNKNYEAWCQDFHVYEVEWDPEFIKFYIDGSLKLTATSGKGGVMDAMHTRAMFPILETQVGAGWVGPVDYTKRETKQNSDFLVDWVRVYQKENQDVVRFDDLETLDYTPSSGYAMTPYAHSEGLMQYSTGSKQYEDKNSFYYGGQPRYEKSRVAAGESEGEQYLVYKIPGVKDVHLTAYYQTVEGFKEYIQWAGYRGTSIRDRLVNNADIDFAVYTSKDNRVWEKFENLKAFKNFTEAYPDYGRITFDAYNLPKGSNFVKIVFPKYQDVSYRKKNGDLEPVKSTDIQLAKVTFLQSRTKEEMSYRIPTVKAKIASDGYGSVEILNMDRNKNYILTDMNHRIVQIVYGSDENNAGFTKLLPGGEYRVYEIAGFLAPEVGRDAEDSTWISEDERSAAKAVQIPAVGENYVVNHDMNKEFASIQILSTVSGVKYALLDAKNNTVVPDERIWHTSESGKVNFENLEKDRVYLVVAGGVDEEVQPVEKLSNAVEIYVPDLNKRIGNEYTMTMNGNAKILRHTRNGKELGVDNSKKAVFMENDEIEITTANVDNHNAFQKWQIVAGDLDMRDKSLMTQTVVMKQGDVILNPLYHGDDSVSIDYTPKTSEFGMNLYGEDYNNLLENIRLENPDENEGKYVFELRKRSVLATESNAIRAKSDEDVRFAWKLHVSSERMKSGNHDAVEASNLKLRVYASLSELVMGNTDYALWKVSEDPEGICEVSEVEFDILSGNTQNVASISFDASVGGSYILSYMKAAKVMIVDEKRGFTKSIVLAKSTPLNENPDYIELNMHELYTDNFGRSYRFAGFADKPGSDVLYSDDLTVEKNRLLYAVYEEVKQEEPEKPNEPKASEEPEKPNEPKASEEPEKPNEPKASEEPNKPKEPKKNKTDRSESQRGHFGGGKTAKVRSASTAKSGENRTVKGIASYQVFSAENEGNWTIDPLTGKWKFVLKNGKTLQDIWVNIREKSGAVITYHFDANGNIDTGWIRDDGGNWYYLSDDPQTVGSLKTGWFKSSKDEKWYLSGAEDGVMKTGWQKISDKWYYMATKGDKKYSEGAMYAGETTPDGYRVDSNGAWIP